MRHGGLVLGISIINFLPEFLQMKENCCGFIGHWSSEEGNGLNDVVGKSFEIFSWINQFFLVTGVGVLLGTAE